MSDRYQILALAGLGEAEVDACVERVLPWLWAKRVVAREGFAPPFQRTSMSRWVESAARSRGERLDPAELERTLDTREAKQLARRGYMPDEGAAAVIADPGAMELWRRFGFSSADTLAFGMEVVRGRQLHAPLHDPVSATCPSCAATTQGLSWLQGPLAQAANAWEETGNAALTCTACGVANAVNAWRFEPAAALAHLAFRFGNWPELSAEFIRELSRVAASQVMFLRDIV